MSSMVKETLTTLNGNRGKWTKLRVPAVGVIMAFAVSGCNFMNKHHLDVRSVPTDGYRTKHPIVVSERPENLDIPVGMRRIRPGTATRGKVAAFAHDAHYHGNGVMYLMVPANSANAKTARWYAKQLRAVMTSAGLRSKNIVQQPYPVDDAKAVAPIRLTFYRIKASVHNCNRWPNNLAGWSSNRGYGDFGCTTQSNLARMVDNPTDLLYPRRFDPSDPMRRSVVFDKYRAGMPTGATGGTGGGSSSSASSRRRRIRYERHCSGFCARSDVAGRRGSRGQRTDPHSPHRHPGVLRDQRSRQDNRDVRPRTGG